MPYHQMKAGKPAYSSLAHDLAKELTNPDNSAGSSSSGVPDIKEELQTYGNSLHVRVIWDKWQGVPLADRGTVIVDAYEIAEKANAANFSDKARRITLAQGLTPSESKQMGIN